MGRTRYQRKVRRNRRKQRRTRRQRGGAPRMDVTIGILSWDAYKTLENTLHSYKKNQLFDVVSPILFFQEISDKDREIADRYQIPYFGSDTNIGLQDAFIKLVQKTTSKYFIFAENDFELVRGKERVKQVLDDCVRLVEEDSVDYVRLRDKEMPGEPLYSKINAKALQEYKAEAIHFVPDLMKEFPGVFTHKKHTFDWYICGDKDCEWSNNIFFAKTSWLREKVLPVLHDPKHATFMMENTLKKNLKGYTIASGPGLFSHNRLDRGEES